MQFLLIFVKIKPETKKAKEILKSNFYDKYTNNPSCYFIVYIHTTACY